MEILIVTFSMSNNGAERVQSELAAEWSKTGHEVTIIQLRENAYGSESFSISENVKLITLKDNYKNKLLKYLSYFSSLLKYFRAHRESLVISFSFTTQAMIAFAHPFVKNKIIFSERNDPTRCPYTNFTRKWRTRAFNAADLCIFQTKEAMAYFPDHIQKKGRIIANPVNPLLPDKHIGPRRKVIITASRLRPQKNLSLLIQAFKTFHKKHPDFVLEIYGIGEEEDKLSRLINELQLIDSVCLCGYTTSIYEKMVDCTMYVCSSDYEGISNSVLEAMGMGLPTISTDCPIGGAREVICTGENGILIPTGDEGALSKEMARIVEEPQFAAQLSENALKVKDQFSLEKIAHEWIEIMSFIIQE